MNPARITTRTLVFHEGKLLLVQNEGADFWYPPGGGLESQDESIAACAEREVLEETGLAVQVKKFLWLREFADTEKHEKNIEMYWLATLASAPKAPHDGDQHGEVVSFAWFTEEELAQVKLFPKHLRGLTFQEIQQLSSRLLP